MAALIGHRGARGLAPENTIDGFRRAVALGVDIIELDVGLTADDVVVVSHDQRLNPDITRGADGAWLDCPGPPLYQMRFRDLTVFDVGRIKPGTLYASQFPLQIPNDGARIPRLADVVSIASGISLNIEMKTFPNCPELTAPPERLAEAVVEVVGAMAPCIVQSFDWRGLRWLRDRATNLTLSWLTCGATSNALWWDGPSPAIYGGSIARAVAEEGGQIWAPDYKTLNPWDLEEAHRLGLRVIPWTVNQPEDMAQLLSWGVDGVITDRPDIFPERKPKL
jgi:glycerophosphoryl diester phosphodiesterase